MFLIIDLAFFGANALKIAHGGWLPLVIGGLLFTVMTTWKTGRQMVAAPADGARHTDRGLSRQVVDTQPARVPGTAVFMTAQPRGTPPALAHNLRYNKVLHEHVVTLMVTTQPVPHVPANQQVTVRDAGARRVLRRGLLWVHGRPQRARGTGARMRAGSRARRGRRDVLSRPGDADRLDQPGMAMWRERLFVLMARNAVRATDVSSGCRQNGWSSSACMWKCDPEHLVSVWHHGLRPGCDRVQRGLYRSSRVRFDSSAARAYSGISLRRRPERRHGGTTGAISAPRGVFPRTRNRGLPTSSPSANPVGIWRLAVFAGSPVQAACM